MKANKVLICNGIRSDLPWFLSNKIGRIELMAAATNEKSIGFWSKVGFQPL